MRNKLLYALWAVFFIICAGLGFMPESSGVTTAASLVFFLPPAVILYRGSNRDRKLVCWLSALSLGLTLALLVANVLSVVASEAVGTALYYLLTIVSTPMMASGYWVLSLFLWACLLLAGLKKGKG